MTTLQVRDFPDDLKTVLKMRAAAMGQSLSEYVRLQLEGIAAQPTLSELSQRIETRGRVDVRVDLADVLCQQRAGGAA